MHFVLILTTLAAVGHALPQAVTSLISPKGAAPSGCHLNFKGTFGISLPMITPTATPKSKPTGGRPVDVAEDRLAIPKLVEAAAVAGPSVQSASAVYDNVLAREDSYDNSVSGDEALSYEHKREPSSPQGNQIQPHSICPYKNSLNLSLNNGILKDNYGRQGYIASNFQFQFDGPPQAGALYTAGFSVCDDGRVALGSSRVWWQCLSGSFYNIYDRNYSAQCHQSYMVALPYRNNCTRPG